MFTTRIRSIAGMSLIAAVIGLAAPGTAATANADSGCVNYSGIGLCWDD